MSPNVFVTDSFKIERNTLWMTNQRTQNGPVANPTNYKFTTLE